MTKDKSQVRFSYGDSDIMTMTATKKYKGVQWLMLLGLFTILAILFSNADRVYASEVEFLDQDGSAATAEDCISVSEVKDTGAPVLGGNDGQAKWYVLDSNVTYSEHRLTVLGEVHLILKDGCKLNAKYGIRMATKDSAGANLTIYAQSTGDKKGELIADASGMDEHAGIGGNSKESGGIVVINGGKITATGGEYGAGIGGGKGCPGGKVSINGGKVTATGGKEAAGIGGGDDGSSGTISITGGEVTAKGGYEGAGLGGGDQGRGETIDISGGIVTATAGDGMNASGGGAGIGGGENGEGGKITITGGTVEATGGKGHTAGGAGAGIGGGEASDGGEITISGGTVTANGAGSYEYSDGSAGIGGGADGGNGGTILITGGKITASGGKTENIFGDSVTGGSGGAGIGGGEGGHGGNITIEAGSIFAYGGQGILSGGGAGIGGGDGGDSGTINIRFENANDKIDAYARNEALCVGRGKAGNNNILNFADDIEIARYEYPKKYIPVSKDQQMEALEGEHVRLRKCPHNGGGIRYTNLHERGHARSCPYCYLENIDQQNPRAHDIDDATLRCVCGYYGVMLSFLPGDEAQGSMSPAVLPGSARYPLPAPDFRISSHYKFAGWMIDGRLYAAGEDYLTPWTDGEAAMPTAIATWEYKAHAWSDWTVTKEATEQEEGIETRVCSYDSSHIDTRAIPRIKHVHESVLTKVNGKPATCTESGHAAYYTCSGCSAIFEDEHAGTQTSSDGIRIPANGHKIGDITKGEVTPATCHMVGGFNLTIRCSKCNQVIRTERIIIPVNTEAHDWGEWTVTKPPTCTQAGEKERICKLDSSHKEHEEVPIDPKAHVMEETPAKEATCTEDGNTAFRTCQECGRYFSDAEGETEIEKDSWIIKATGHSWDDGKVTAKPTTAKAGTRTYTCTSCGATKTESIPKLIPTSSPKPSGVLAMKMVAKGEKNIAVSWNKVAGAEGYDLFFSRCNGKSSKSMKKLKTLKGNGQISWTVKGLKKHKSYKAYVKAWKMKNGRKVYIKSSLMFHAYTTGGTKKYTNPKSVTVNRKQVSLKQGKTFRIKGKVMKLKQNRKLIPQDHAKTLRYQSTNKNVAAVTTSGTIKAVGKGTCTVYVFTTNGLSKTVKVTVK